MLLRDDLLFFWKHVGLEAFFIFAYNTFQSHHKFEDSFVLLNYVGHYMWQLLFYDDFFLKMIKSDSPAGENKDLLL